MKRSLDFWPLAAAIALFVLIAVVADRSSQPDSTDSAPLPGAIVTEPVVPPTAEAVVHPTAEPVTGSIVGSVTDADGRPLKGIKVHVVSKPWQSWTNPVNGFIDAAGPTWDATTDENGHYRVDAGVGARRVVFEPEPTDHATAYNGEAVSVAKAPNIILEPHAELGLDATLHRIASVRGTIAAPSGKPVRRGLRVEALVRSGKRWVGVAVTGSKAKGRYAFTTLAPGEYRVRVERPRSGSILAPGTSRSAEATSVVLSDGEQVKGLDIEVPPAAVVTITMVTDSGRPLAGHPVRAHSGFISWGRFGTAPPNVQRKGVTDAAGQVRLHLPTGEFFVESGPETLGCGGVDGQAGGGLLRVHAGEVTSTEVTTYDPAEVSGRILDRSGAPLGARTVHLEPRDGCQIQTLSDDQGRYEQGHLRPGVYRISVTRPDGKGRGWYYPGVWLFNNAELVRLAPGSVRAHLDLQHPGPSR